MVKRFLSLEWKSFVRSASFGKGLALKILMGFLALYFIAIFLVLGLVLYPGLKKVFPDQDPLKILNSLLFYWILGDLFIRFFFQKLPVMLAKPLLTLPIKTSKIVNYILGKSALSFFNFLPLFAIIPFGITLIVKEYPTIPVLIWMLSLVLATLIINFLNFVIESYSSETELSFLPIIIIVGGLFVLNYFEIISLAQLIGFGFDAIYSTPFFIVILAPILISLYVLNYKLLRHKLFLDSSLKANVKEVNTSNLEWTRSFGDIAPFMQLDLKLLWRNKRSKSSVWILVIGLLYGLFFYPQPTYQNMPWCFALFGIFVSGIFLLNFGQLIPGWVSGYYKLVMSQYI